MTNVQTETKVVKRYANRKLYDTQESKYITLAEIRNAVVSGQHVQVLDNVTKVDITGPTLLSAIVETESDVDNPVETFREVLLAGGLHKYISALKEGVVAGIEE